MEEDKTLAQAPITDDLQSEKPSPYDLLMRQSRKLGGVATRTFDVTKEFLKQDVSTLHPDKILFGIKSSKQNRPSDNNSSDSSGASDDSNLESKPGEVGSTATRASEGIRENQERDTRTLDPREGLRKIVRKSQIGRASCRERV